MNDRGKGTVGIPCRKCGTFVKLFVRIGQHDILCPRCGSSTQALVASSGEIRTALKHDLSENLSLAQKKEP